MRGGFGPFGGGAPVEKPMNFRRSVRRLLERLSPDRMRLAAVILLGVTSVAFLVIGPKILGARPTSYSPAPSAGGCRPGSRKPR